MINKTTKRSRINFKLFSAAFFSLFIFTQCARNDTRQYRKASVYVQPQQQVRQQRYPQQYYPAVQNYNPYYGAPRSQAYSDPYDFAPPYGQSLNNDNDQTYELPNEYQLR